ncbi:MAG: ATP-dependent DNA helicase RecG [Candidatus Limnocylindria bacterium]
MRRLRGVGTEAALLLERLGIRTIGDLLWHLPRTHEDFSKIVPLRSVREASQQTVIAQVGHITTRRTKGATLTEMELRDESGVPTRHRAVWFGRQFIQQRFQEGQLVRVSGRTKWFGQGLSFDKPTVEPADREAVQTGRIVPVYPLTGGLKQFQVRRWLHTAVEGARDRSGALVTSPLVNEVPDPLPAEVVSRYELPSAAEALRQVHFPDDPMRLFHARRRLAFEELLVLQLATAQKRARWIATSEAVPLEAPDGDVGSWMAALPFELTRAQRRSLDQIRSDLARRIPMTRLLQGDVGSGKTVVAALAMRIAVASGAQAALMAPTELLAEQHHRTLGALFGEAGAPRLELLTSSVTGERRVRLLDDLARQRLDVVVGTHALLEEGVGFARLALAVVDEQHRFGVEQRAKLREKGIVPHVLLTTATPIPQTLSQTIHRDLDLSTIDELPGGREDIKTEVRPPDALPRIWPWVRERVALGEQAFVVCPRIDPSEEAPSEPGVLFDPTESAALPSAVATEQELRAGPLRGLRIALVHGRIPQRERDAVMARFREGEIDVLVATTVIEVGIDIPNATVMVVLGAERFGLAQLHQLRGRVGRGERRSFCVLVSPARDSERLAAMTERKRDADGALRLLDGFDLASRDLQIRGPGQFLGQEQSGFAEQLRIVDLADIDPRLLEETTAEADRIVAADPELARPEHAGLREAVDDLWQRYAYA